MGDIVTLHDVPDTPIENSVTIKMEDGTDLVVVIKGATIETWAFDVARRTLGRSLRKLFVSEWRRSLTITVK